MISWNQHGVDSLTTLVLADMMVVGTLLIIAQTLTALGHARLRTTGNVLVLLCLVLLVLSTLGYFLVTQLQLMQPSLRWSATLGASWVIVQLASLGFIVRAWRRWQKLPHAFLATGLE